MVSSQRQMGCVAVLIFRLKGVGEEGLHGPGAAGVGCAEERRAAGYGAYSLGSRSLRLRRNWTSIT